VKTKKKPPLPTNPKLKPEETINPETTTETETITTTNLKEVETKNLNPKDSMLITKVISLP